MIVVAMMRAPCVFAVAATVIAASAPVFSQAPPPQRPSLMVSSTDGRDLYAFYCASCHGRDGKGNGPVRPALKGEPPDLTRLALRNNGTFPRARLEAIVTGSADPPLSVHGSREMPVWGPIFSALDRDEALNRVRIANILDYLETLQLRYADLRMTCPRRISP